MLSERWGVGRYAPRGEVGEVGEVGTEGLRGEERVHFCIRESISWMEEEVEE